SRRNRADRGGLAGARASGHQRQTVPERVANAGQLLIGEPLTAFGRRAPFGLSEPLAGRGAQQLADAVGKLCLELRGLAAVDPASGADDVSAPDELVDGRLGNVLPRRCAEQLRKLR